MQGYSQRMLDHEAHVNTEVDLPQAQVMVTRRRRVIRGM